MSPLRPATRLVVGAVAAVGAPALGVVLSATTGEAGRYDPQEGLQQLDLLHLDEPAPGLATTGSPGGEVVVLLFCDGCPAPRLRDAAVVRVTDQGLARAYGLGVPGSAGYALVDTRGHVRWTVRT